MRCIFCKANSSSATSVEHIVPRSLGRNEYVLQPGVVCDACNNYFASKVEERGLSSAFFRDLRFRNVIPSKKGRVPPAIGFFPRAGVAIELRKDSSGWSVSAHKEKDNAVFATALQSGENGSFRLPAIERNDADPRLMARFLGKMALEYLASRMIASDGGQDEIVDHPQLDLLRHFVRYGQGSDWGYSERRIYAEDARFEYSDCPEPYQVLHEFDLLYTKDKELFFVCAILGIEFAINMGDSSIGRYSAWLEDNDGGSILLNNELKPNHLER
jgi:hypothetical protein